MNLETRRYDFCDFPGVPHFFRKPLEEKGQYLIGHSIQSRYKEDQYFEKMIFERRGTFPCLTFTKEYPHGEIDFVSVNDVQEITEEDFIKAHKKLWKAR